VKEKAEQVRSLMHFDAQHIGDLEEILKESILIICQLIHRKHAWKRA
jgi:hypothetical protein